MVVSPPCTLREASMPTAPYPSLYETNTVPVVMFARLHIDVSSGGRGKFAPKMGLSFKPTLMTMVVIVKAFHAAVPTRAVLLPSNSNVDGNARYRKGASCGGGPTRAVLLPSNSTRGPDV